MFPSLATMKTMLTRNSADHYIKMERELLIAMYDCLWNVSHEDCMNTDKKEVAYFQIDAQMSEKYHKGLITKANVTKYEPCKP